MKNFLNLPYQTLDGFIGLFIPFLPFAHGLSLLCLTTIFSIDSNYFQVFSIILTFPWVSSCSQEVQSCAKFSERKNWWFIKHKG